MHTSIERRLTLLERHGKTLKTRTAANAHCAQNIVDWIGDWLWTYDPRLVVDGQPAHIPFDLFPRQAEYLAWVGERNALRNMDATISLKSLIFSDD